MRSMNIIHEEMDEPPTCQQCGESISEKQAISVSDYYIDKKCWENMHASDLAELLGFPVVDIKVNKKIVYEVLPKGIDNGGQTDTSEYYS